MKLPLLSQLTPEQYNALMIPLDESVIVIGPPGSGKTVIALYRLAMANDAGRGTLLLTHGNVLRSFSTFASDTAQTKGVANRQMTFDSWFSRLHKQIFGYDPPTIGGERNNYNWEKILLELDPAELDPGVNIDIIIDEGQDLPKEFYLFADHIGATTTIFADPDQRISDRGSTLRDIKDNSGISKLIQLHENFRNTPEIAAFAEGIANLFKSSDDDLYITNTNLGSGRVGSLPRVFENTELDAIAERLINQAVNTPGLDVGVCTSTVKVQERIFKMLQDKIVEYGMSSDDLDVQQYIGKSRPYCKQCGSRVTGGPSKGMSWCPNCETNKSTAGSGKEVDWIRPDIDWDRQGIKLIQYSSAKGLEFESLCLPDLQNLPGSLKDPEEHITLTTFYMLVTRARNILWLSYSGEGNPRIMRIFKKDLME